MPGICRSVAVVGVGKNPLLIPDTLYLLPIYPTVQPRHGHIHRDPRGGAGTPSLPTGLGRHLWNVSWSELSVVKACTCVISACVITHLQNSSLCNLNSPLIHYGISSIIPYIYIHLHSYKFSWYKNLVKLLKVAWMLIFVIKLSWQRVHAHCRLF